MTVDFTQPVLINPTDGSYIVTTQGPAYPYNVLPGDPMWQSIQDWLAAGNTATPYVPPAAKAPDPVAVANATLAALTPKIINAIMVGPSAPLQFAAQWLAAWKAAGN